MACLQRHPQPIPTSPLFSTGDALSKTTPTRKRTTGAARRKPTPAQAAVEALGKYEEALKTFRKGEYGKAIPLFEKVAASYPAEREIVDRARVWMSVAQARSAPAAAVAKTALEHHDRGVLAANDGRLDLATEHFEEAVKMDPGDDRGHYGLATASALRGDTAGAVSHLGKAIEINPANRVRALNDVDFDALREDAGFMALLGKGPEDGR